MKHQGNRDLWLVTKNAFLGTDEMNAESAWLNEVLNKVESTQNLATCCEVLNLVKYRVEKKYDTILKALSEKKQKPFIFIFNKN